MGIAASRVYDLLEEQRFRPAGAWLYLPGAALGAALIALSALVYRFIEEPANRWLRTRL